MENPKEEWPHVGRIVWCSGGVVAVNNPGREVRLTAGAGGALLAELTLPTYRSLFSVIRNLGMPVVGATFVESVEEARGLSPAQFRAFNPRHGWLLWDVDQTWRQIAHAAGKRDEMALLDVASRVASSLNYSEMRLLDLADAYSTQLRSKAVGKREQYSRFKDVHSAHAYKAIHALFWEIAVLRDVLAEFAATYCFALPKIATMRGLVAALRKAPRDDALAQELVSAADDKLGGWLAKFSAYRNLFTHGAPMQEAAGVAYTVQDTRELPSGNSVPQIYYPLPASATELMQKRSAGPLFASFEELVQTAARRHHDRSSEPDALEYLWECIDNLGQFAKALAARSAMAPQMIEISPEDLRGPIRVVSPEI